MRIIQPNGQAGSIFDECVAKGVSSTVATGNIDIDQYPAFEGPPSFIIWHEPPDREVVGFAVPYQNLARRRDDFSKLIDFDQYTSVYMHARMGFTAILLSRGSTHSRIYDLEDFLKDPNLLSEHPIELMILSPLILRKYLRKGWSFNKSLKKIIVHCGCNFVSLTDAEFILDNMPEGIEVDLMYYRTWTGAISYMKLHEIETSFHVGWLLPDVQVKISDEKEISVKSPVTSGIHLICKTEIIPLKAPYIPTWNYGFLDKEGRMIAYDIANIRPWSVGHAGP